MTQTLGFCSHSMIVRSFAARRQSKRIERLGRPQWWLRRERQHNRAIRFSQRKNALRGAAADQRRNVSIARELAWRSRWLALTSLLLFGASELLARWLCKVTSSPLRLWSKTIDLGTVWTPFVSVVGTVEPGKYDALAAAAVGAEATILALFYATIGVVASTAYSSVAADIRDLFVRERTGDVYTRGIVRGFVFTTALLTANVLGYHARALSLIVAALLAVVAVLRLMYFGTSPFRFLEPAALTGPLLGRFADALRLAALPPGVIDEGSQRQAHRDAAEVLECNRRITDIVSSRAALNSEAPLQVARQLLQLNRAYATIKDRIPSDSEWWGSITGYPNWFTASASTIGIALSTSTGIIGGDSKDHLWVERRTVSDICQLLNALSSSQLNQITTFTDKIADHIRELSASLQTTTAELYLEQVNTVIWTAVNQQTPDDAGDRNAFQRDRVITAQRAALLLTNAWLGLVVRAMHAASWDLAADINQAVEHRERIYLLNLPRRLVELMEHITARVNIEQQAEGQQITPPWWIHHRAARTLASQIVEAYHSITAKVGSHVIPSLDAAIAKNDWDVAAMTALSALELVSKIEGQASTVQAAVESLKAHRNNAISDGDWPTLTDLPPVDPRHREKIFIQMSQCLPHLCAEKHHPTRLDLYGQIHVFLFDAAYEAILNDELDLAGTLFTALLAHAGITAARLIQDLEGQSAAVQAIYISEPIIGLMELSGAAILLEELNSRGIWDLVRDQWEQIRNTKNEDLARQLVEVTTDVKSVLGVSEVGAQRVSRRQRLSTLLRERGVTRPDPLSQYLGQPPSTDATTNPILAAFAPDSFTSAWDLTDLFLVKYVGPLLPEGVPLPQSARSLARTIDTRTGDSDSA